jgi:hypothetical protein
MDIRKLSENNKSFSLYVEDKDIAIDLEDFLLKKTDYHWSNSGKTKIVEILFNNKIFNHIFLELNWPNKYVIIYSIGSPNNINNIFKVDNSNINSIKNFLLKPPSYLPKHFIKEGSSLNNEPITYYIIKVDNEKDNISIQTELLKNGFTWIDGDNKICDLFSEKPVYLFCYSNKKISYSNYLNKKDLIEIINNSVNKKLIDIITFWKFLPLITNKKPDYSPKKLIKEGLTINNNEDIKEIEEINNVKCNLWIGNKVKIKDNFEEIYNKYFDGFVNDNEIEFINKCKGKICTIKHKSLITYNTTITRHDGTSIIEGKYWLSIIYINDVILDNSGEVFDLALEKIIDTPTYNPRKIIKSID